MRRLLADNPGPFTFKGTLSYIVGRGQVAIIDPGPLDEAHIAALLAAVRGETVTHIFVTHTHRDHSPAVPRIKAATGAQVLAEGPHRAARALNVGELPRLDASNDTDFRPDRALADGELISAGGWTIEAVATPGHTANHMAFALREANILFSGDHVMAWSTPVVAPPDGAMSDYMASLQKLARRGEDIYLPGHGGPVRDAPRFVEHYIRHRQGRERVHPATPGRGRSRYSEPGRRHLCRARSTPGESGRAVGPRPSRGSDGAQSRRGGRPGFDRRALPLAVEGQRLPQCMKCRDVCGEAMDERPVAVH